MFSMIISNCVGFWRTFEVILEEDEEHYRSITNELVAHYKESLRAP